MRFGKKDTTPTFHRMFRFPLSPTREQAHMLSRFAGSCRATWNILLEYCNGFMERKERVPDYYALSAYLTSVKKQPERLWLNDVSSQSLQMEARYLSQAFGEFFKYLSERKKNWRARKRGHPKFHKRGVNDSFCIPQGGIARVGERTPGFVINLENSTIRVPNIKTPIKCNFCRDVTKYKNWSFGKPKTAVFKRHRKRWYVCISVEFIGKMPEETRQPKNPVGVDCGIARSYQLSDGSYFNIPDVSAIDRKIRSLQRHRNKKCTKKSRQWKDLTRKVRELYSRKTDITNDFLHKFSTELSQAHDLIVIEALEIMNMTKSAKGTLENPGNHVKQKSGLNRSILLQKWGTFRRFLKYKMEEKGHILLEVPPQYTSQTCPVCGYVSPENRVNQKSFVCQACGHAMNADENAAINILRKGIETLPPDIREYLLKQLGASGFGVLPSGEIAESGWPKRPSGKRAVEKSTGKVYTVA